MAKRSIIRQGMLATLVFFFGVLPAASQTLRIGLQEDPDALDPHRARTFVGRIVFSALCDKLMDVDEKLQIVPQLATSWSWSADDKVLTLKLRSGVKFHDGETMDATAVKASLDRARTLPDSLRKSELASVAHVDVVDPSTVTITVNKPDATLLYQLTDRAGMILAPKAMTGDFSKHPVCAGPYKFVERVQNDRIVLEKFKDYWNPSEYFFQRIVYQPIPDATVRLANLRAGSIDILERLAPSDVASVKSDPKLNFDPVVGLGFQAIALNIANGPRSKTSPFRDKRVRQAFNIAIDRDAINKVVGQGFFAPANQALPLASPFFNKAAIMPKRDVAKAKALLKEAGYDRVKFELTFANNTVLQQVSELIQAMAAEAGFDIQLRATDYATALHQAQGGNFEANMNAWSGRPDPDGNLIIFVSCKGSQNDGHYCNPEVDKLLMQARTVTDLTKRKAVYDAADKIMQDDVPRIYLYYQPWLFATSKKVVGFKPSADGLIRVKDMKFAN